MGPRSEVGRRSGTGTDIRPRGRTRVRLPELCVIGSALYAASACAHAVCMQGICGVRDAHSVRTVCVRTVCVQLLVGEVGRPAPQADRGGRRPSAGEARAAS